MTANLGDAKAGEVLSVSPDKPMQFQADERPIKVVMYFSLTNYSTAVIKKGRSYYLVEGYNLLDLILRSGDKVWGALYRAEVSDIAWPAFAIAPDDPVSRALDSRRDRGIALNAVVVEKGKISGIITTLDLARFIYFKGALKSRKVTGSPAVFISPETSLHDAISTMMEKKIRRLLVKNKDAIAVISDRSIMRGALDSELLMRLGKDPAGVLGSHISSFPYMLEQPSVINADANAHIALKEVLTNISNCALTDDGRIVTPLDLVLQAFSQG